MLDRITKFFSTKNKEVGTVEPSLKQISLQADNPIDSKTDDIFDRASFAEQIAAIIASRSDKSSLVIGLYGPWGDGKTSTLAMIKEAVHRDKSIITMDYNPWFYGDTTEQLTRGFFASIQEKLEKSGFFKRENIGVAISAFGSLPYVGEGMKNIGKVVSTEALTKARDKLGRILQKHGKKIVIFIDDIDRLDRADIQALFKLVRLSGGFDYTTYILAFDDRVVAEALGQAYGVGDPVAGRRFLEKIVQVPLHLPPARAEKLRSLLFSACDRAVTSHGMKLNAAEGSELGSALAGGLAYALKTPRQVKLFDNAISFALPLLKGEVRVVDQIQIEALRIFYPDVYEVVRKNPGNVLNSNDRRNNENPTPVQIAIRSIVGSAEEQYAVEEMLTGLFPRFGNTSYGRDWETEWAAKKQICSSDYFNRYFCYSVPTDDLSDTTLEDLIASASVGDDNVVGDVIAKAASNDAAELLFRKLRSREASLPIEAVPTLIDQISINSSAIPITNDIFAGDFTVIQAAKLIVNSAARTPNNQDALLTRSIELASSLYFAALVISHCIANPDKSENPTALPPDRLELLSAALFTRVQEIAVNGDVFEGTWHGIARVLSVINLTASEKTKSDLRMLLTNILQSDATTAIRLVKAYAGRSQSGDGPITASDLSLKTYQALEDQFDISILYDQLQAQYKLVTDGLKWIDADDGLDDVDRRLANQFVFLHQQQSVPQPDIGQADHSGSDGIPEK